MKQLWEGCLGQSEEQQRGLLPPDQLLDKTSWAPSGAPSPPR